MLNVLMIIAIIATVTLGVLFFIALPIYLTYVNIRCLFDRNIKERFEALTLLLGPLFSWMWMGLFVCSGKEYYQSVILDGNDPKKHVAIAGEYAISFEIFAFIGIIAMFILCHWKKRLPPLAAIFLLSAVILGNIINIPVLIQLRMNIVMCIYPLNFLCMTIRVFRDEAQKQTEYLSQTEGYGGAVQGFLTKRTHWLPAAFIALIPLTAVLIIILMICGQGADGIIKVFTMTADRTFSTQIPPPSYYIY